MVNKINKKRKENIIIALFLAPSLLIFMIFILYPVFNTIYLSFSNMFIYLLFILSTICFAHCSGVFPSAKPCKAFLTVSII